MSVVAIDPQISGVVDDGTDEGSVRAALVRGELVMVPFTEGQYSVQEISGTSAATYDAASYVDNPDGSSSAIFVVLPQTTDEIRSGLKVTWVVWGTVVGVRWLRSSAPNFSCIIDGESYGIPNALTYPESGGALTGLSDAHNLCVVARDLPDGPHVVSLVFVGSPVAQYTYAIYGYLAERRAGYRTTDRLGTIPSAASALLSAAQNRIWPTGMGGAKGMRKVLYFNEDNAEHTVTIKLSGNTIRTITLAAGASAELDFGLILTSSRAFSGTGSLTHAADTASKVRATVIVGV